MRTIHAFALVTLALVVSVAFVSAQSPARPRTNWEFRGQGWLTNYYGKTLSSLGEIVSVKIEPSSRARTSSTNRMHTTVWRVIEHSKMQDYCSMSVALDVPPMFTIEFTDGTRVRGNRYAAHITWPDRREGLFVLAEEAANQSRQPTSAPSGLSMP